MVGATRLMQESDIPKLPYLPAIKEAFRLHPAGPLVGRLPCVCPGLPMPIGLDY